MDDAAAAGYFDILKYLHSNRKEGMSCYGFNYAAANGHFEVVCFLHENRTGKNKTLRNISPKKIKKHSLIYINRGMHFPRSKFRCRKWALGDC
jgi:hypothetical protein